MELIIYRQSVCMADDMEEHTYKINLPDNAVYEDLYHELRKQKYFPSVAGNNVVWVLTNNDYPCIFSYFTYDGTFHACLEEAEIGRIDDGTHSFCFQYYYSPKKWKECIMKLYDGKLKDIYHDGWEEEIKYCNNLSGVKMVARRVIDKLRFTLK